MAAEFDEDIFLALVGEEDDDETDEGDDEEPNEQDF